MLGPFLFSIYVSPIVDIITVHGIQFHQDADDTQLYIAIHSDNDLARMEKCTSAVKDWFTENGMFLNPDKSEVPRVSGTLRRSSLIRVFPWLAPRSPTHRR